jgi:hypothetical protein
VRPLIIVRLASEANPDGGLISPFGKRQGVRRLYPGDKRAVNARLHCLIFRELV